MVEGKSCYYNQNFVTNDVELMKHVSICVHISANKRNMAS
jgi:hypothetical protein